MKQRLAEGKSNGVLRQFVVLLLLLLFAIGLWQLWLAGSAFFSAERWPIRQVVIENRLQFANQQRLSAIALEKAQAGFWFLDLPSVHQALLAEPWIKAASIRRNWPDQLQIVLEEHRPLAAWGPDAVLTTEGLVIRPKLKPEKMSVLFGPPGSELGLIQRYLDLRTELKALGFTLSVMMENERGSIYVLLDGRLRVVIGREDYAQRVARLKILLTTHGARLRQQALELDARYSNGIAVAWQ